MGLTRLSLNNPVAVVVAVILVLLFAFISLSKLPIQLTPEVKKPEITISTSWRAAAPEEIESEIIDPQERALRGLPGSTEILAKAQRGRAVVTLTFRVGTDLRRALLEVMNRLNRVARYPTDADEPIITTVGGNSRAIAWFIIKPKAGNENDIASYQEFVEDTIQSRFERVPGVALSEVRGGREKEIRITFDPFKAAHYGIGLPETVNKIANNKDTSGGFAEVGKRRYTLRYQGAYDLEDLNNMIIAWQDSQPVYLRDIATTKITLADRNSFVIQNSEAAIAVNAHRESGVNVLEVMQGLKEAAKELSEGPLQRAQLEIEQVYDETLYIHRSMDMLRTNLLIGIVLAILVLWWFLRKLRATLMVALAIPICVISSFIFFYAAGRTLNVISLAGLAFSVGMVLDAAIIVLENIVRRREQGDNSQKAALNGTQQVWGALLASTVTTVAIFLPIVFLKDESGQLFADLALTLSVTITLSLIVAVTVLPTMASLWLKNTSLSDPHNHWWDGGTRLFMRLSKTPLLRFIFFFMLIFCPLILSYVFKPNADYLPQGNRNLVFAFILPPPGMNMDTIEDEMGNVIAERMKPYINGEKQPQVKDYFFVSFSSGAFMGARTQDPKQTGQLVGLINQVVGGFPDTLAFAKRTSLFGGFGGGRTIDVNIQARDIDSLLKAAQIGFFTIKQTFEGSSVRPFPGLDLAEPELSLSPNERRIIEAGWNRQDMGQIIRALGDGLFVGDSFNGDKRLDIILRSTPWQTPEELASLPLHTPNSGTLPLKELAQLQRTAGPEEIRRLNRRRTITLQVTPPPNMDLETAMQIMREKVDPVIRNQLPQDGTISYTGTADKLATALLSMGGSFLLAIAILYLLISALFRSFLDSLIVMAVFPTAILGGILALNILNIVSFQPMDLLTMIGFIILLGLVVNNAILLVHQTRAAEWEGISRREAVEHAIRLRLRPILMTTLTSTFGMLPLLLIPGAGTELYRGMAGVIVGGMLLSTFFTLILLPCLLRIGEEKHPSIATPS